MDGQLLSVLLATVAVWWGAAKNFGEEGVGVVRRHVQGLTAGVFAGCLVMVGWAIFGPDEKPRSADTASVEGSTQREEVPARARTSIAYEVVDAVYSRDFRIMHSLEVMLPRRLSEQELEEVAYAVRDRHLSESSTTLIGFFVAGQTATTYWARVKFKPEYTASIVGLSVADYQQLADTDLSQYPTMVGSWLLDGPLGHLRVLYKVKNSYKLDRIFTDGKRTENYNVQKLDGQRLRLQRPEDESGEYYVLLPNGDLEGWTPKGKYAHLPQFKAPPMRN